MFGHALVCTMHMAHTLPYILYYLYKGSIVLVRNSVTVLFLGFPKMKLKQCFSIDFSVGDDYIRHKQDEIEGTPL